MYMTDTVQFFPKNLPMILSNLKDTTSYIYRAMNGR